MGGRPGEVSTNWAVKRLKKHPKTIRRWCQEGRISCRAELGPPVIDGERRVVRYWLAKSEIKLLAEQVEGPQGPEGADNG